MIDDQWRDPPRLSQGLGPDGEGLRQALMAARSEVPSARRRRTIAAGLSFLGVAVGAKGVALGALGGKAKLVLLVTAIAAASAGGVHVWRSREAPKAAPAVTRQHDAPRGAPVVETPTVDEAPPAPTPTPAWSKRRKASPGHAIPAGPDVLAEAKLLDEARDELKRDPGAALEVLRRHERKFPAAALEQERALLRVEALVASRRSAEAAREAAAFERRHPGSMHLARLRQIVGR